MPLLSKDRTRMWFLEALNEAQRTHRFELWAWVIMPEHVHLLLWPSNASSSAPPNGKIARILADLKRPVGQKAIGHLEQHAPEFLERLTVRNRNRTYRRFWQAGPGYDENVSDFGSLHEIVEYIHNNPIRRGLVARAEDWPWSSARDWLGLSHNLPCLVDRTIPSVLQIPVTGRRSQD